MPFAILSLPQKEFLPSPIPSRPNHKNRPIVCPPDDSFSRLASWNTGYGDRTSGPQRSLRVVINLEMCRRKGVDVRKDARQKRYATQETPFLIVTVFAAATCRETVRVPVCPGVGRCIVARILQGMREIEDVQGGFVGGDC